MLYLEKHDGSEHTVIPAPKKSITETREYVLRDPSVRWVYRDRVGYNTIMTVFLARNVGTKDSPRYYETRIVGPIKHNVKPVYSGSRREAYQAQKSMVNAAYIIPYPSYD